MRYFAEWRSWLYRTALVARGVARLEVAVADSWDCSKPSCESRMSAWGKRRRRCCCTCDTPRRTSLPICGCRTRHRGGCKCRRKYRMLSPSFKRAAVVRAQVSLLPKFCSCTPVCAESHSWKDHVVFLHPCCRGTCKCCRRRTKGPLVFRRSGGIRVTVVRSSQGLRSGHLGVRRSS